MTQPAEIPPANPNPNTAPGGDPPPGDRPPLPPRGERDPDPMRDPGTADRAISDVRRREQSKALKDLWGTDDPDEIARLKLKREEDQRQREKERTELEQLRAERQNAERAKMSEVERLTTDLKTANDRIKELEAQLSAARQETLSERQSANIRLAAVSHNFKAKPSVMRLIMQDYAAHYLGLSSAERRRLVRPDEAQKALNRWMKDYAKDNPELLQGEPAPKEPAAPARPAAPATQVVRRPVGAPPARPAAPARPAPPANQRPPGVDENGKTVKPGLPNSMNAKELAEYQRKMGLKRRTG